MGRRGDIPGVSSVIGSRHDVLDEKEKKKKSKREVAGQSRLVKYPFLSRDVVALFRAAGIACTGEYGPFEELSFGGLDKVGKNLRVGEWILSFETKRLHFWFWTGGGGQKGRVE